MDQLIIGSISGTIAGILTNPLDVVKIRMQLQGELCCKGLHKISYKGIMNAVHIIYQLEGFRGFYKGTLPSFIFQFIFSGIRLGAYQIIPFDETDDTFDFQTRLWAATLPAMAAGVLANPFFLIKIQLQSRAHKNIAHGYQHQNNGKMMVGFKRMIRVFGYRSLLHGIAWRLPLIFFMSSVQLISFDYTKFYLSTSHDFQKDEVSVSLMAALVGGVMGTLITTPGDVVSTRMYNQGYEASGRGYLYNGFWDCWYKSFQNEGLSGLYKGAKVSYFRLGPYTLLTLMIWDELIKAEKFLLETDPV